MHCYIKRKTIEDYEFLYAQQYDDPALYLNDLIEYKEKHDEDDELHLVGKYYVFAIDNGDGTYTVTQQTETPLVKYELCMRDGRQYRKRTFVKKENEKVYGVFMHIAWKSPHYKLIYSTNNTIFHTTAFRYVK